VSTAGFGLLAGLWLASTWKALDAARNGRIAEHRRWMIRSFALTFAAVTLRLYLPFAFISPIGYVATYRLIGFACWVPNLAFAEVFLVGREALPTAALDSDPAPSPDERSTRTQTPQGNAR
jgi:Predicted membrane protein (DUF2306)